MHKDISELTDDCIGFSILLSRILRHYAKKLGVKVDAGAPKIANADWTFAEKERLVPPPLRYEEMLQKSYGILIKLRDDD